MYIYIYFRTYTLIHLMLVLYICMKFAAISSVAWDRWVSSSLENQCSTIVDWLHSSKWSLLWQPHPGKKDCDMALTENCRWRWLSVIDVYRISMDISSQPSFLRQHLGHDSWRITCDAGPSEDGATEMKIMAKKGAGTDGIPKVCFAFFLNFLFIIASDQAVIANICIFKLG